MITALFMLPGIAMTIMVSEPLMSKWQPKTLREAIVEPFREFISRLGWRSALLVLAFMFFYKLGDSMATALATPFYLDIGFTKTEIGLIAKNAGLWPSIIGGPAMPELTPGFTPALLWASQAWLPGGWQANVLLRVAADGC